MRRLTAKSRAGGSICLASIRKAHHESILHFADRLRLYSGSSAANAGTIYDLPRFIAAAAAGDEVRLLADQGAYNG